MINNSGTPEDTCSNIIGLWTTCGFAVGGIVGAFTNNSKYLLLGFSLQTATIMLPKTQQVINFVNLVGEPPIGQILYVIKNIKKID